jgi:hypothetical protein
MSMSTSALTPPKLQREVIQLDPYFIGCRHVFQNAAASYCLAVSLPRLLSRYCVTVRLAVIAAAAGQLAPLPGLLLHLPGRLFSGPGVFIASGTLGGAVGADDQRHFVVDASQ